MTSASQNFLALARHSLEEEAGLLGVMQNTDTSGAVAAHGAGAGDCSELELELVYESSAPDAEARARFARGIQAFVAGYAEEGETSFVTLLDSPLMQVTLRFVTQPSGEGPVLWERDGALTAALSAAPRARGQGPGAAFHLQWAEDRIWLWVHRAACHLGRAEVFAALDLLAKIRAEVLAPLLSLRHGREHGREHGPSGGHALGFRTLRSLEAIGGDDLSGLRASVALYDARSCEISLREAAKLYLGLRESLATVELRRNRRAELAILRHLHSVSEGLAKTG